MNKSLIDEYGEVRELTHADFAKFRPLAEVMPSDFVDMVLSHTARRKRGKQKAPTKRLTTIRFDADIIEHFKAQGKGWQTAMNNALREYIATH